MKEKKDEREKKDEERLSSLFSICCPEGGGEGKRMGRIPINTGRKGEDGRQRKKEKEERERRRNGENESHAMYVWD